MNRNKPYRNKNKYCNRNKENHKIVNNDGDYYIFYIYYKKINFIKLKTNKKLYN